MDVDIVVLWVDGNDPEWLAVKNKYSPDSIDDSNSPNRFRDWGLMRYWFRCIEVFMPWVRTIHFVTWGHIPEFLNTEHPKLHIVRHEDYIPSKWLPTFSANPLEMNMHRIPGLAEHFIYFNDDMFVLKPMKMEFFFKNGLPCTQATEIPLGFVGKNQVWSVLAANDLGLINEHFSKKESIRKAKGKYLNLQYKWIDNIRTFALGILFPKSFAGFKNFHCPVAFRKSTFQEIWKVYPDVLENTSSHKFRSREDVNQWLALWWQIVSGKFTPRKVDAGHYIVGMNNIDETCNVIKQQKMEMICIGDNCNGEEFVLLSSLLQDAFETILSNKSSFEK